jgi:hypothetical protein
MTKLLAAVWVVCIVSLGLGGTGYAGSAALKVTPNKLGNVRLVVPGPNGPTVVCVQPSTLAESIPCCKHDDQGCICSSDDCDDCKDVTRQSIQSAPVMRRPNLGPGARGERRSSVGYSTIARYPLSYMLI